jgi:NAD(P)H-quinone oxidoreductase subunit 5
MSSYLLIGFWFTRPGVANACQKAFVTNRVGDFGLLLGILGFYSITGSFEFQDLPERLFQLFSHDQIAIISVNLYGILFFLGPVAKSAQFPLHIWLPDAMEGPTPISALIHAATMVAAGIFLVARMLPVFQMLPFIMDIISWVGIITASLGASIALAQRDLKKGLAYSTMSQLGYMILSLGIGSYKASLFHLITHAYSKALLFLGAGSVIHSVESILGYHPSKSQNMNLMGGLRKYMPITAITFLFGTLSLSGIPPFACFWSKDEIISSSWLYSPFLGFIASFTAALTAYYMFRIYLLTFEGDFRGHFGKEQPGLYNISIWGSPVSDKKREEIKNFSPISGLHKKYKPYPKESDNTMLFPLIALSIPTLFIGIIGVYTHHELLPFDSLSRWLYLSINPPNNIFSETFVESLLNAFPSIGLALIGISIAFFLYAPFSISKYQKFIYGIPGFFSASFDSWSYHRGYVDGFYNFLFIKSLIFVSRISRVIDEWIIDGLVNGIGILSFFGGESFKYMEGGRISSYLFFLVSCMFLFSLYSYIT